MIRQVVFTTPGLVVGIKAINARLGVRNADRLLRTGRLRCITAGRVVLADPVEIDRTCRLLAVQALGVRP